MGEGVEWVVDVALDAAGGGAEAVAGEEGFEWCKTGSRNIKMGVFLAKSIGMPPLCPTKCSIAFGAPVAYCQRATMGGQSTTEIYIIVWDVSRIHSTAHQWSNSASTAVRYELGSQVCAL